jgi:hypothetical protein
MKHLHDVAGNANEDCGFIHIKPRGVYEKRPRHGCCPVFPCFFGQIADFPGFSLVCVLGGWFCLFSSVFFLDFDRLFLDGRRNPCSLF